MNPIRTAIIEDNMPFALMFKKHFDRPGSGIKCLAIYPTAEAALEEIPLNPPEVALVDINLPGMSGIECIKRLKLRCPSVHCLVLTTFHDNTSIFNALKAGASGYLLKRASAAEIVTAIQQVREGVAPISPHIARQVISFFHTSPPTNDESDLTEREQQIIELLASGLAYKQIADFLNITFETVRTHVKNIYQKLHAHSRMEAVTKYRNQR